MRGKRVQALIESAIMIALGTVLSMIKIDMPYGGGLTICSMLPLVVISYRHGVGWGGLTAFVYSLIQLLLGMDNVQYATNAVMAAGIILLDYVVAYTVIGFAGLFRRGGNQARAMVLGIAVTFTARFACHFITGWAVWDALWPNEFGLAAPIYSLVYNGAYMLPEIILTAAAAILISRYLDFMTLKKSQRAG